MQALPVMVMAVGRGERLAPWTLAVPKPLLPIANEPCISHLLRLIASQGFRRVVINASHHAELLQRGVGSGTAWGVDIAWSLESEPLGTAGGLRHALPLLAEGTEGAVVCCGDGLHDIDIAALVRQHNASGATLSFAVHRVLNASNYGVVEMDGDRVVAFREKPHGVDGVLTPCSTGVYVFSPRAFEVLESLPVEHASSTTIGGGVLDIAHDLIPELQRLGEAICGFMHDGYWNDVGNEQAWLDANLALASQQDGVVQHRSAVIGKRVVMQPPVVIGQDVVVGDDAQLHRAVLLPGAHVIAGSHIEEGVVGEAALLAEWANGQSISTVS